MGEALGPHLQSFMLMTSGGCLIANRQGDLIDVHVYP